MIRILLICLVLAFSFDTANAHYDATVLRVVDGDTLEVRIDFTPQLFLITKIRVNGVDTPEKRSKCKNVAAKVKEKEMAALAQKLTELIAGKGTQVTISLLRFGKYAGRYIADVQTPVGNLAKELIKAGLGREYHGGKRKGWC